MPVILLLGVVIGFLIYRDNKLKDTLKKDLLAADNDVDGELDRCVKQNPTQPPTQPLTGPDINVVSSQPNFETLEYRFECRAE
jgi:hypothetical protein